MVEPVAVAPAGFAMPPDHPAAWQRAQRLGRSAFRRLGSVVKALYIWVGVATGIGLAAHLAGLDIWLANAVALVAALVCIGLACLPFRDRTLRTANEIIANHQLREGREWRAETGTRMPRGRPAIRRWLDEHPDTPGRGSLLTVIGRFAEAEVCWRSATPDTPGATFAIEIQRETAVLLAGRDPDLGRLRTLWAAIPNPLERENRRECLAILAAQAQVASIPPGLDLHLAGADPIAIVAAARDETGPVTWRARVLSIFGFHVVLALLPVLAASVIRVIAGG
jgi:hypothetical protein